MSEKIKYFDPDFWRHPDLWRIGKEYAETKVVLNTAIFEAVTLADQIVLVNQSISVLGGADLRSLVPILMVGTIALIGLAFNASEAGQQFDLSGKAIKAGGVSDSMLRDSTNHQGDIEDQRGYIAVPGYKKNWKRVISDRRYKEKYLRAFADRAVKRECERTTKK